MKDAVQDAVASKLGPFAPTRWRTSWEVGAESEGEMRARAAKGNDSMGKDYTRHHSLAIDRMSATPQIPPPPRHDSEYNSSANNAPHTPLI